MDSQQIRQRIEDERAEIRKAVDIAQNAINQANNQLNSLARRDFQLQGQLQLLDEIGRSEDSDDAEKQDQSIVEKQDA